MLAPDELSDLAEDIKVNGLIQPIVLDAEGTLIDGRNRLAACAKAGVSPQFASLDGHDPVAFILASNIHRRHLSQGQRAMLVAKGRQLSPRDMRPSQAVAAAASGVEQSKVSQANVVLEWAPDLVDQVIAGGSLNEAYEIALEVKQSQRAIRLAIEEIGSAVPVPDIPDLSAVAEGADDDPAPAMGAGLKAQDEYLKRIIAIKKSLADLYDLGPAVEGWSPEGQVAAVRSAISQIMSCAVAIAQQHDIALVEGRRLRVIG
jgi:anti-sigma regulatory factor (Ser/Thr protein kinase)